MGVAMSVDRRVISSFDARIGDYYSGWKLRDDVATQRSTWRDIMWHRTGLWRNDAALFFQNDTSLSTPMTTQRDLIYRTRYLEAWQEFRTRGAYSNYMFSVMGYMHASLLGYESWQDLVTEMILKPLNMSNSAPSFTRAASLPGWSSRALPIMWDPDTGKFVDYTSFPHTVFDNAAPASGISTTLEDLLEFIRVGLLRGNRTNANTGERTLPPLLSKSVYDDWRTPSDSNSGPFIDAFGNQYIASDPDYADWTGGSRYRTWKRELGSGSFFGYESMLSFMTESQSELGIAVLGNTVNGDGSVRFLINNFMTDVLLDMEPIVANATMACQFPCGTYPDERCTLSPSSSSSSKKSSPHQRMRVPLPSHAVSSRLINPLVSSLQSRQQPQYHQVTNDEDRCSTDPPLTDYIGVFSHPAYLRVNISMVSDGSLLASLFGMGLPCPLQRPSLSSTGDHMDDATTSMAPDRFVCSVWGMSFTLTFGRNIASSRVVSLSLVWAEDEDGLPVAIYRPLFVNALYVAAMDASESGNPFNGQSLGSYPIVGAGLAGIRGHDGINGTSSSIDQALIIAIIIAVATIIISMIMLAYALHRHAIALNKMSHRNGLQIAPSSPQSYSDPIIAASGVGGGHVASPLAATDLAAPLLS
jgi:CubicO group peptidase (beta-lactamase class C family)